MLKIYFLNCEFLSTVMDEWIELALVLNIFSFNIHYMCLGLEGKLNSVIEVVPLIINTRFLLDLSPAVIQAAKPILCFNPGCFKNLASKFLSNFYVVQKFRLYTLNLYYVTAPVIPPYCLKPDVPAKELQFQGENA